MSRFLAAILVLCAVVAPGCERVRSPDLVFVGGVVHTGVDGDDPAEAVSVLDGRIVQIGSENEIRPTAGRDTQIIDLEGAHLYPGFTDSHVHLLGVGERELELNLDRVGSIGELVETVAQAGRSLAEGQVLFGRGWIETRWPEARFPNRQDLDRVSQGRPVVLVRADGHALVANTVALRAAGINLDHPIQPDGGRIDVDPSGVATGMLIDNAMALVSGLMAERSGAELETAYEKGGAVLTQLGWTGAHNMSVPVEHVALLNSLSEAGKLPVRLYNAVDVAGVGDLSSDVFGQSKNGLVITRAVKLYMDGALGSRGALLAEPYADRSGEAGLQLSSEAETLVLMREALKAGVQVAFHAIGDRANTLVLDWMEKAFADLQSLPPARRDPRWRIEHAQILSPGDTVRFAKLGVVASMQPSHAIGDLHFAPSRLGPERLDGAYAWRSLIDAGAIITGGSDAPVEKGDPRIEFYAAVARKDLTGFSTPDWRPEQTVTRAEALKMFTIWPAYASFRETELGTIEAGKIADFSVFSGDLLTVPEDEILSVEPVMTVIEGRIVWSRNTG